MEIIGYISAIAFGAMCLLLAHFAGKLGMDKKYTRKLVHLLVGFEWVILYTFLGAGLHSLIICVLFLAFLTVAYAKKLLPAISSDSDNAPGTVYYAASMSAIAISMLFLPEMMLPFGVAVLCTSLGDGLAGIVGQAVSFNNPKLLGNKTLVGTLTNFAVCFVGILIFAEIFDFSLKLEDVVAIALLSAALELITPRGLDNVTVPIGVAAFTYALVNFPAIDSYTAPIILLPLFFVTVISKRVLTFGGALMALAVGGAVAISFKNGGFILLCSFLILSVLADYVKGRLIGKSQRTVRDAMQVFANGGAALVLAVAYPIVSKNSLVFAFVAVVAEALADTVASALGAFDGKTVDLFRMKKCVPGTSGGVSVLGTAVAFAASFLIPTVAFLLRLIPSVNILALGALAFLGTFVDTLIASLFEEKLRCKKCGALTDEKLHCGKKCKHESGFSSIDNNATNLISTVLVAIVVILIYM